MYRYSLIVLSIGALMLSAGCGEKDKVELRYDRPAQYQIAPSIKTLGIAQFGGRTAADRQWGDIASDRLAVRLDEYNNKYHRYQLVDRKRLKAILDERDLQAAFSDSSQAVQAGKVAHVDAMIYGTVNVTSQDDHLTRTQLESDHAEDERGPIRSSPRDGGCQLLRRRRGHRQDDRQRVGHARLRQRLAEILRQGIVERDQARGHGRVQGPRADRQGDLASDRRVRRGVPGQDQPARGRRHRESRKGKSEAVKTGNKLAMAKDYAEALEAYQAALREKPDDHDAVFNAGVMYEALGKLGKAEEMYDKAFKMKPETQYVQARKRVRLEAEN